jgi:hypothetical protein
MPLKPYTGKEKDKPVFAESKMAEAKALLAKEGKPLFFSIERSSNSNQVCYYANKKDGKIDPDEPVKVEWIMWEKCAKGSMREGLTMIERNTAYGINSVKRTDSGDYLVILSAIKDFPMIIRLNQETGEVIATVEMEGKKASLLMVYVFTVKGWTGIPSVEYTDFFLKFEGSDAVETRRLCA